MIYLYTGQPGTGKTLNSLKKLVELSNNSTRPVYVCGVKLTEEFPVRYKELTYDDLEIWPDIVEDNAVVFIDEAQKLFRPRSSSAKVPLYVSELETHRHRGLDFVVVTQYPNLLDSHLSGLVGQHIHIGLSPLGQRRLLIWDRQASPRVKSDVQEAKKVFQKLPTEVFPWYVSSVENRIYTAKRSYVKPVLIVSALLLLVSVAGFVLALVGASDGVKESVEMKAGKPAVRVQDAGSVQVPAGGSSSVAPPEAKKASSPSIEAPDAKATHKAYEEDVNNEWERTVYSGDLVPYDSPVPAGCVASRESCNCYSERGRRLEVEPRLCRKIALGEHMPFKYKGAESGRQIASQPPVVPLGPEIGKP